MDSLEEEYTQFSRTQLLRGVTTENGVIGGVKQILNEVYGMFNEELIDAKVEKNTEKIEKIQKVFDNWGPLLVFVEAEINKNEDLYLIVKPIASISFDGSSSILTPTLIKTLSPSPLTLT